MGLLSRQRNLIIFVSKGAIYHEIGAQLWSINRFKLRIRRGILFVLFWKYRTIYKCQSIEKLGLYLTLEKSKRNNNFIGWSRLYL